MSSSISKNAIKKYYEKIKKLSYDEIYNQLLDIDEDSIKFKLLNRRLTFLKNNKQEKTIRSLEKESINILDNIIKLKFSENLNERNERQVQLNKKIYYDENIKQTQRNEKILNNESNNGLIKPYSNDSYGGFASYP